MSNVSSTSIAAAGATIGDVPKGAVVVATASKVIPEGTTAIAVPQPTFWDNIKPIVYHFGAQLLLAAGTGVVLYLQHADFSSIPPAYAAVVPMVVAMVVSGWNTASGWLKQQ